ncbi:hypothetical protein BCR44DRAFT_1424458 [Catenaria anguillulae PL171]|uniref:Uncharacterized protein n=1 Tax=Catenaria anguillulae PL171 TaxID=765915 RepID=A0A1Y2HZV7_9FUNG|nr:hypothetical protein BCR44DRAFT_1424458 [Catenaria anguillulae PL171]
MALGTDSGHASTEYPTPAHSRDTIGPVDCAKLPSPVPTSLLVPSLAPPLRRPPSRPAHQPWSPPRPSRQPRASLPPPPPRSAALSPRCAAPSGRPWPRSARPGLAPPPTPCTRNPPRTLPCPTSAQKRVLSFSSTRGRGRPARVTATRRRSGRALSACFSTRPPTLSLTSGAWTGPTCLLPGLVRAWAQSPSRRTAPSKRLRRRHRTFSCRTWLAGCCAGSRRVMASALTAPWYTP